MPENSNLRDVDDGREVGAADAAQVADRERPALHVLERELAAPWPCRPAAAAPPRSARCSCWSTSRMTGTSSPYSVSTATPMWTYFLSTTSSLATSIDALNCGNTFSADAITLSGNRRDRQLPAGGFDPLRVLLPQPLEFRDVGLVALRDVRHRSPGAGHPLGRLAANGAHRLALDLAPLREVRQRDGPHAARPQRRRR